MHKSGRLIALTLIAASVIVLFVGSCFLTASDGQGAFVFIFTAPLAFGLLVLGYFLDSRPKFTFFKAHFLAQGFFWILFFVSAFVPPLRPFSQGVVERIAKASELVTGMTPYMWARRNQPAALALDKNLREAREQITLEQISVVEKWNRICVFAPYTTEKDAGQVIGYYSATMARSRAAKSDRYVALVFINDQGTIAVLDADRNIVDLVPFSNRCLTATDFPLPLNKVSR